MVTIVPPKNQSAP